MKCSIVVMTNSPWKQPQVAAQPPPKRGTVEGFAVPVPDWVNLPNTPSTTEELDGPGVEVREEIVEARQKAKEDAAMDASLFAQVEMASKPQTTSTASKVSPPPRTGSPVTPPRAAQPPAVTPAATPVPAAARSPPAQPENTRPVAPPPQNVGTAMPAGLTKGGGMSQVRVYEQLLALRQRMSTRLSETNKYARFLELELTRRDLQVKTCQNRMKMVGTEAGAITRSIEELSKQALFGVDKELMSQKIAQLAQRLSTMETLLKQDVEGLDLISTVEVPVSWMGVAEEIKIMGSFDNWTRGVELSAEDYTYSGEQEFSAVLELLPGQYEVKFLVDGQWLLGPGMPTTLEDGYNPDCNNILVVEPATNVQGNYYI